MSGCSTLVKKEQQIRGKEANKWKTAAFATLSGRYGLVLHLATKGFGRLTGETSRKIGQKCHGMASKCLASGRKRMPGNQRHPKLHYTCHCLFPQQASALQSEELVEVKIFNWLEHSQNVKIFENEWDIRKQRSKKQHDRSTVKKFRQSAKTATLLLTCQIGCRGHLSCILSQSHAL